MKNTSIVIVVHGDRILILRRSASDKDSPFVWGFPGGGVDKGESFIEGASRELWEETDLFIPPSHLCYIGTWPKKKRDFHVYVGTAPPFHVKLLDGEHDDFAWIYPSELEEYEHFPKMDDFLEALFHQG
jgi:8-oxo-dGTP diphosphatase